jgi:hypothetical protein
MTKQLSSEFIQRRLITAAAAAAIGGGLVGGLIGHANGVNDERDNFINNGVTCDIRVAAGETEGAIEASIVDKLGVSIPLTDLDSNGVIRTPDNSHGFPDPGKYPEASDILQGKMDMGTCINLGGIAVKAS